MVQKKVELQRKLERKEIELQKIRARFPNHKSRKPKDAKKRKQYAALAKPVRLKINALRYYIRLEEKKIEQTKQIAYTVCELCDIETIWQKGRARSPQITKARHLFVVIARQSGIGTKLVQWYLNLSAKSVSSIPPAYRLGWKRVRKDPDYRESYNRIIFALKSCNGKD